VVGVVVVVVVISGGVLVVKVMVVEIVDADSVVVTFVGVVLGAVVFTKLVTSEENHLFYNKWLN
jgi:vancomycin permeability regulator SanA